ncbi:MAG: M48 family metalloprotease [Candidatus Omnitrophica bacterium]|nr:M48 family metalloprotease [Candidatus Omnitrophota bacterium]
MVSFARKSFIFLFLLLLSGCATIYNPATQRNEMIFINSQTEASIGRGVAPELLKKTPLSKNENLQKRAEAIGRRLAAVSDRQDIEYHFAVIEDKELNAVTLPGGYIYINRGLIDILNDDELAFVLAHETGHVSARHIAKKLQAGMAYQLLLGLAFAGFGKSSGDNAQAIAAGVDTVYSLVSLSYSRQDEYLADKLGTKYAYKAGFDPNAAVSALEKLKQKNEPNIKVLEYFRTHPYVDERIVVLKRDIPLLYSQK